MVVNGRIVFLIISPPQKKILEDPAIYTFRSSHLEISHAWEVASGVACNNFRRYKIMVFDCQCNHEAWQNNKCGAKACKWQFLAVPIQIPCVS